MTTLLRFTLDLFGFEQAAPPSRRQRAKSVQSPQRLQPLQPQPLQLPVFKPNEPVAQSIPAGPAIESIANTNVAAPALPLHSPALLPHSPSLPLHSPALPLQTIEQSLPPTSIRHPRATREALLQQVRVGYEFKRGKRRTIGFSVGPDGLAVRAPKWVPLAEVDKAVLEKSGWILKKLEEMRDRSRRLEASRIEWADGCSVLFLGQPVRVLLDPRHAFTGVGAELQPATLTLRVGLPQGAAPAQIRDAVQAWLMRQAKSFFTGRLHHFAPTLGVQWRKLGLSSAGTRWGSASADGSIRLNWRLIHFKPPVIDYVVVHELSHLRVMDHSPRFWDTVREVVPDYALLRSQLKDEALPRW